MKKKSLFRELLRFPNIIYLQRRVNTLESEIEVLQNVIKDELYKTFMEKLKEPYTLEKEKKENKILREKVKTLKILLKEE